MLACLFDGIPPHQMISTQSHAKLNWFLRVKELRQDGYHELETVFQELTLADKLTFEPIDAPICQIEGFPPDVPPDANLIRRAWRLLCDKFPHQVKGVSCRAEKILPRGGGLGGGSSNAAAALRAINHLYSLSLSAEDLEQLGAALGSDVSFFVRGGCALGTARGEKLQQFPHSSEYHVVLLFPSEGISTQKAFARLDSLPNRLEPAHSAHEVLWALEAADPRRLARLIWNDFELAVAGERWFETGRNALLQSGALAAFLCGSGSTIAGLAENLQDALEIEQQARYLCHYTSICTRALSAGGEGSTPRAPHWR